MITAKHSAHKYKKLKFSTGFIVYRCMLPGCAHYVRIELAKGRLSLCWRCGEEHVIINTKLAKQHCDDCYKTKKEKKFKDSTIDTLLEVIG